MRHLLEPSLDLRGSESPSRDGQVRIDMHCHSTFSDERIRFLPRINYHPLLQPTEIYDLCIERGMDYVTITDHDTINGCLDLLETRGPLPRFIIGEEVSVVFPEDKTVIHCNVYDIDEAQHREFQRVRKNFYDFVDYARSIDKLFVLNHMTWTQQHRVLKPWQIEVMLEHFDVFEGINGTRSYPHNAFVYSATRGRDKVLVAGSDSHTNRMGTTYTRSRAESAADLLTNIRAGISEPCGAFGTAEKLREDVWLVMCANVERRLEEASGFWERAVCRAFRRIGRYAHPVALFGYHTRQNMLIRKFLRNAPGLDPNAEEHWVPSLDGHMH